MPLVDLDLAPVDKPPPANVRAFLRDANRRIERFLNDAHIPGFVPSDYERGYNVLRAIAEADAAAGSLFCEWGSGLGVVTCLAAMLDFEACGIEIEGELVDAAEALAADFDLAVEFIRDSFIPKHAPRCQLGIDGFSWLTNEGGHADERLGLATDDFDVIFAYPWPDEEDYTERLFERYARVGAVLVTYHGGDVFRVRRKTAGRPGRKRQGMAP